MFTEQKGLIMKFATIVLATALCSSAAAESIEDYRVDREEAFYSCSSENAAMELFTMAATTPYWDAQSQIDGYERSVCPLYTITGGLIPAETLRVEVIEPSSTQHDRIALIKWSDSAGQTYYTIVIRSTADGLWHDTVSTMMGIRALNGVIDLFK